MVSKKRIRRARDAWLAADQAKLLASKAVLAAEREFALATERCLDAHAEYTRLKQRTRRDVAHIPVSGPALAESIKSYLPILSSSEAGFLAECLKKHFFVALRVRVVKKR